MPTIPLNEQLRQAIEASGLSVYRISQDSGVSETQIGRFRRGERDLYLATAAKVATALGLTLSRGGGRKIQRNPY